MLNHYPSTSLKNRILFGYFVVQGIMILAVFWGVFNFYRVGESIKLTMSENYSSIMAVENLGKSLDNQQHAVYVIFNQDQNKGKVLFQEEKENFYYWFQKAKESAYTDAEKTILKNLDESYTRFLIFFQDYINNNSVFTNISSYEKIQIYNKVIETVKNLKLESNKIYEINHNLLQNEIDKVGKITSFSTVSMVLIMLIAVVIGMVFGLRFTQKLIEPIQEFTDVIKKISDGDFNYTIEKSYNFVEIDELSDEFNKMSSMLRDYYSMNLEKILYEQKKSDLMIQLMKEPVLLVDEKLNIINCNKAFNRVFEIPADSTNIIDINSPVLAQLSEALLHNKVIKLTKEVFKINIHGEKERYYKIEVSELNEPSTQTKGWLIILSDITSFKEIEKMKNDFIGNVSHELKTPLTSLGMALDLLNEEVMGEMNEKQKDLLKSMDSDYERLKKLVHDILELSKIESASREIKFENTSLDDIFNTISKKFQLLCADDKIDFMTENHTNGLNLFCNRHLIISALENLLFNAIKFTGHGGKIGFILSGNTKEVSFEITDTGIGISEENTYKIFDKFVQIQGNIPGSVGLGLSLVKEIVDLHKGEISVKSKLNKGSVFKMKFMNGIKNG